MGRHAMLELVLDCSDPEQPMGFWGKALGYRGHYSASSLAVLVPQDGQAVGDAGRTATSRWSPEFRAHSLVTMADPENNEFCVSTGVEW
jgi:hypothetical protein